MISLSTKIRVLNLNKLENNVTWGSLHSFITNIRVSKIRIADCSWFNFQGKLLNTRNNLLRMTKMTFFANNFTLSLTSWALLSIHIIVSSSKLNSTSGSSLTFTFLTCHNIIRILSSWTFTMRTSYLFFNQYIQLFTKIEVFKLQKDFYFQLWAFKLVKVELLVYVGVIHFFNTNSIVQKFLILVVKSLICWIAIIVPTFIFSNFSRDLGFLSGWYFLESFLKFYLTSSGVALTGNSSLN
jgi:hypothetical protein